MEKSNLPPCLSDPAFADDFEKWRAENALLEAAFVAMPEETKRMMYLVTTYMCNQFEAELDKTAYFADEFLKLAKQGKVSGAIAATQHFLDEILAGRARNAALAEGRKQGNAVKAKQAAEASATLRRAIEQLFKGANPPGPTMKNKQIVAYLLGRADSLGLAEYKESTLAEYIKPIAKELRQEYRKKLGL